MVWKTLIEIIKEVGNLAGKVKSVMGYISYPTFGQL